MRSPLVASALILASLGACSAGAAGREPVASCTLAPTIDAPAGLPSDFPQPPGVALTRLEVTDEFVSSQGYDRRSVEELFADIRPLLVDEGFDIVNSDFEGFEAELYFARDDSLGGIVSLREDVCDGYVKVNVVYDPLETAAARRAVRKTRELSGEG